MRVVSIDTQGSTSRIGTWTRPKRVAAWLRRAGFTVDEISFPIDNSEECSTRMGPALENRNSKAFATIEVIQANLEAVRRCLTREIQGDLVLVHEFESILAGQVIAEHLGAPLALTKMTVLGDRLRVTDELWAANVEEATLLQYVVDLEDYSMRQASMVLVSTNQICERMHERWPVLDPDMVHVLPFGALVDENIVQAEIERRDPSVRELTVLCHRTNDMEATQQTVAAISQLWREGQRIRMILMKGKKGAASDVHNSVIPPWIDVIDVDGREDHIRTYSECDILVLGACGESPMLAALDALSVGTPVVMAGTDGPSGFELDLPLIRYDRGFLASTLSYVLANRAAIVDRVCAFRNSLRAETQGSEKILGELVRCAELGRSPMAARR